MGKEEAIREIKRFMSILPNDMQEAIMVLVPELAESEDERIRKELKEAFEAYDIESTWNGIPIRSIFAWLEKHKELFESGRGLYYYDGEKTTYCGYPATEENPYDFAISQQEKKKEQKPAWSEEDEKMLRTIISDGSRGVELDSKQISFLKSLRPSWKSCEGQKEAL